MSEEVIGTYECINCGERTEVILPYLYEIAIGGANAPAFDIHHNKKIENMPCVWQFWKLVEDE